MAASDSNTSSYANSVQVTRRDAIKLGAAAMAFHVVPRHTLGGPKFVPPSEKVNVALIGCGGRAQGNFRGLQKHQDAQVIAVADPCESVDMAKLKIYRTVAGRLPAKAEVEKVYSERTPNHKCADYEDFREMLDKHPEIDACLISTPDHQHAHGALHAMRAGKHVYCEKPLTHNIREARVLRQVAEESGVATQMGNQGHSRPTMAETIEHVQGGSIGEITEVHAWVPARRWNPELVAPPTDQPPKPEGLNWDLWLGPREERPYHPAYVPVHWRDFWDFGCGALGDFACHDLDSATWSLNLSAPKTVEAFAAGLTHDKLAPHGAICRFDFPELGDQKACKVTWYDGGLMPEFPEAAKSKINEYRRGVMFVGTKGHMFCKGAGGDAWVLPADGGEAPPAPKQTIRRVEDHYRDWLDACKGGPAALSNFDYATRLTEITLLGVLAIRAGQPLEWDHENARATNVPNLEPLIEGTYRKGWEVV